MRFIGGKTLLLDHIKRVLQENTDGTERVFCDIFSGTGTVARYFKPDYEIISTICSIFLTPFRRRPLKITAFLNLKAERARDSGSFFIFGGDENF